MEAENKAENKPNMSLIEGMFDVGAHFGYARSRRHPSFKSVIFGSKNDVDIMNLEKTGSFLAQALELVRDTATQKKTILFAGTKPETRKILEKAASSLDIPYVSNRWIGGILTNFPEIQKRISYLETLQKKKEKGEFSIYTKKERLGLDKEIEDLTKNFGGIASLNKVPNAIFVVDPRHERTAVLEAKKSNIPVIALAGSDCNLDEIDYPIPANDSSPASVSFFILQITHAYEEGMKKALAEPEDHAKASQTIEEKPRVMPLG